MKTLFRGGSRDGEVIQLHGKVTAVHRETIVRDLITGETTVTRGEWYVNAGRREGRTRVFEVHPDDPRAVGVFPQFGEKSAGRAGGTGRGEEGNE